MSSVPMVEAATLTPQQIARRWECRVDVVLKLIRRGDLLAFNISVDANTRPRWKVTSEELARFEAERTVRPRVEPKKLPRRKRRAAAGREYV